MNDLALVIVNTSEHYKANCANARIPNRYDRLVYWTHVVNEEVANQGKLFGTRFTYRQGKEAVDQLDAYYQEHITEMEWVDDGSNSGYLSG